MTLRWCLSAGESGDRQLASAVYYLATADIEGDGTDEVLFGPQTIDDRPGSPAFKLWVFGVDPAGTMVSLGLDGEDAPLIEVSSSVSSHYSSYNGISCVDIDDDGRRSLITNRAFTDVDGAWNWSSSAITLSTVGAESVQISSGTEAADGSTIEIERFGDLDCGGPIDFTRVGPPASVCEDDPDAFYEPGDFDGDGEIDQAYIRRRGVGFFFAAGVCTSSGVHDEYVVGGQGRAFQVADLNRDGIHEIWTGDKSGPAAIWSTPLVVQGDRLAAITLADGGVFAATQGSTGTVETNHVVHYLGCTASAAGETAGIVTLSAENAAGTDEVIADKTVWDFRDGVAHVVESSTEVLPGQLPAGFGDTVDNQLESALSTSAGSPCL